MGHLLLLRSMDIAIGSGTRILRVLLDVGILLSIDSVLCGVSG